MALASVGVVAIFSVAFGVFFGGLLGLGLGFLALRRLSRPRRAPLRVSSLSLCLGTNGSNAFSCFFSKKFFIWLCESIFLPGTCARRFYGWARRFVTPS